MKPLSVIIPVHNREAFIEKAVESVLAQTYQNFELIIVDDGSTDRSMDLLQQFQKQIQLIRQEQRGASAARNSGIQRAQGEWLTFLDSDDLWLPEKLSTQVDFVAKNPDCKICYTEEIWYRNGRRVNPARRHRKHSGWIYQKMLPLCLISPSSVMVHRSVLEQVGTFDEDLPACEDYDLWLRIGAQYPVYLITTPLIIKHNGHAGQLSQQFWGMDRFRLRALIKMLESGLLSSADEEATRQHLEKKCRILAMGSMKRGKVKEAEQFSQIAERFGLNSFNQK